ncbi:hypothetical protein FB645_004538 [Coemansia sp. IMI 203386]|nr:hypothetical protein FB645_004538 [Coemansia sp. IMI 203386]
MFEFFYRIWILKSILLYDYSRILRPVFNFLDDVGYYIYRPSGCYGTKWDKSTKTYEAVLQLEIIKGKDIPRTELISTFSQYVHIRVSDKSDYCNPVINTDNEPKFRMTSYFNQHLYSNTIIEISLCNDGVYRDKVVGRVTIPLKELHDVRTYHGWIPIDDLEGNPAGYLYLASKLRMSADGEYKALKALADEALDKNKGEQWARQNNGRSKDRASLRTVGLKSASNSGIGMSARNRGKQRDSGSQDQEEEHGEQGGQEQVAVQSSSGLQLNARGSESGVVQRANPGKSRHSRIHWPKHDKANSIRSAPPPLPPTDVDSRNAPAKIPSENHIVDMDSPPPPAAAST